MFCGYCRTGIIRRLGGAIVEPMIRNTSSSVVAAAAASILIILLITEHNILILKYLR